MYYKYVPEVKISHILKEEARKIDSESKINKSVWYFVKDSNIIVICTNCPGYWIGYHGENIKRIRERIKEINPNYKVEFIDCDS